MPMTFPDPGVPEALSRAMFDTLVALAPTIGMTGRFVSYEENDGDDRLLMSAVFSSFIQRGLIVPGPNLVPDQEVVRRRTAPLRRGPDAD